MPPFANSLEQQFHQAMLGIYEAAGKLNPPYRAGDFIRMVASRGGKDTADALLATPNVSTGFTALWDKHLSRGEILEQVRDRRRSKTHISNREADRELRVTLAQKADGQFSRLALLCRTLSQALKLRQSFVRSWKSIRKRECRSRPAITGCRFSRSSSDARSSTMDASKKSY